MNGNKAFQSQEKRDEECIWSGVAHEGAKGDVFTGGGRSIQIIHLSKSSNTTL